MLIDPELEEILLRWEELCDRPERPTLEELCRDHPERLDEARRLIGVLEDVAVLIGTTDDDPAIDETSDRSAEPLPDEIATGSRCRGVRRHARGGLGEVFVAWDFELRREVALKLIQRPHDRDPERRRRFLREAEITARLGHPGIVPIFGVGRTGDGRPCYTMRYIEGETLRAAIVRFHESDSTPGDPRARLLELRGLVSRLVAVCHAVAFAHSRGVIHRDLKPDNIMLGPFQETLVVDWGLAKRLGAGHEPTGPIAQRDGAVSPASRDARTEDADAVAPTLDLEGPPVPDDSLTRAGSTLGTPAFMSPEQASGRWHEVGPASDVYGLGATLYFLLTGRPAFENRSRSRLLEQVRRGEFPPPGEVKRGTPRPLEAICLKAMAVSPGDRYASVLEMATDLDRWLADEPVCAWREPRLVRMGRWVRRHRPLVVGVAALAATAIVALGVSTLFLGREQARTKLALDNARANYRLARTTMANVQTSFGLSAAERRSPAEAALWFAEAAATADVDPDRALTSRIRTRGWCLVSPTPTAVVEFPRLPRANPLAQRRSPHLAFDRSGRYLLAISKLGACAIHDVRDGKPVALSESSRPVTAAAWGGRQGNLLALATLEGKVKLIRFPQGIVVDEFPRAEGASALEFSQDGRLLAVGGVASRVWNVESRAYVTPELTHPRRVFQLALNPRADRLAAVEADGRVWVFDTGTPRAQPLFQAEPNRNNAMKTLFRPLFVDSGRAVLTLPSTQELAWIDATTGVELRRLKTNLAAVYHVLSSPDGRSITATGLGGVRSWDAATGQLIGQYGDAGIEAAAYTRDGAWLVLSSGYYLTAPYRFPGGEEGGWVLKHSDLVTQLVTSPDGEHFALGQDDELIQVWRFSGALADNRTFLGASPSVRLAMSADGTLVMPLGKSFTGGPTYTQVHDLSTGRKGPQLSVNGILHGGAIAPDGRQVVTLSSPRGNVPSGASELQYRVGSTTGWIQFWDWRQGTTVREPVTTPSEPIGAAYDPGGRHVAVLCALGELLWIDATSGMVLQRNGGAGFSFSSGTPCSEMLRFSPDGKLLVHWATGPPLLKVARTRAEHAPGLSTRPYGPHHGVLDARFSPDGRFLATGGTDKSVRVWDLATGQPACPPLRHPDWIFQVAFSQDGSRLLTGCRDKSAYVWDWRSGRLAAPPLTHQGEVQDVRFLNSDRWVLTKCSVRHMTNSGENSVQIWDWREDKPLTPPRYLSSTWGSQLCLTPDGLRAVLGSNVESQIHVVDLESWVDHDDPRFPPDRLRQVAELYSGRKIVGGSSVVSLTTAEWLERWRSYQSYLRDRVGSRRPDPSSPRAVQAEANGTARAAQRDGDRPPLNRTRETRGHARAP